LFFRSFLGLGISCADGRSRRESAALPAFPADPLVAPQVAATGNGAHFVVADAVLGMSRFGIAALQIECGHFGWLSC